MYVWGLLGQLNFKGGVLQICSEGGFRPNLGNYFREDFLSVQEGASNLVQIHHPSGRNVLLLTAQMHRQHSLQRKNSGRPVRRLESAWQLDNCDVSIRLEVKHLCVSQVVNRVLLKQWTRMNQVNFTGSHFYPVFCLASHVLMIHLWNCRDFRQKEATDYTKLKDRTATSGALIQDMQKEVSMEGSWAADGHFVKRCQE